MRQLASQLLAQGTTSLAGVDVAIFARSIKTVDPLAGRQQLAQSIFDTQVRGRAWVVLGGGRGAGSAGLRWAGVRVEAAGLFLRCRSPARLLAPRLRTHTPAHLPPQVALLRGVLPQLPDQSWPWSLITRGGDVPEEQVKEEAAAAAAAAAAAQAAADEESAAYREMQASGLVAGGGAGARQGRGCAGAVPGLRRGCAGAAPGLCRGCAGGCQWRAARPAGPPVLNSPAP